MSQFDLQIDKMNCPSCAAKIESRLLMEEGIEECTVNIAEKKASVTGSIDPEKAAEIITEMGYPAKVI